MFELQRLYATLLFALFTATLSAAQALNNDNCQAFGVNIGNGGTYFINLASTASFSFVSGFSQCVGSTTPILQFPSGAQYTCSTINIGLTNVESVCPVQHNQLFTGIYTIFFPEIGFARAFTIVNTQSPIAVTSQITAIGTVTPILTSTDSSTSVISSITTLVPQTLTLPAATQGTLTLSPFITITSTSTILRTIHTRTTITATSTSTQTPACTKAVITPAIKDVVAKPTPKSRIMRDVHREQLVERALVKRDGPDGPLITTITIYEQPTVILITAAPSTTTTTITIDSTSFSTVTPLPVMTFSGTVENTVTLSTRTATHTTRSTTTSTITITQTRHIKAVITVAPPTC